MLQEGEVGFCKVRKNRNGENIDSLYGCFYPNPEDHNPPGSYTIVFPGCNLKCWFCASPFVSVGFNGDTSRWPGGTYRKLAPHEVVERVKKSAGPNRGGFTCGLMGLFGGEAGIHLEYLLEVTRLCHEAGCASKIHTCGFLSEDVMRKIAGAVNVVQLNVKGSLSPRFYGRMGADPDAILRALEVAWNTPRVDGRVRDTAVTLVSDLVGPSLEPTLEEVRRFGNWLVEKTDPWIHLGILPEFQPRGSYGHPKAHDDKLIPGDGQDKAADRLWTTGLTLYDCGLENVWLSFTGFANVHVPSRRHVPG